MELQCLMQSATVQKPPVVSLNKTCPWVGHRLMEAALLRAALSAARGAVGRCSHPVSQNSIGLFFVLRYKPSFFTCRSLDAVVCQMACANLLYFYKRRSLICLFYHEV